MPVSEVPRKRRFKKRLIISYFTMTAIIIILISLFTYGKVQKMIIEENSRILIQAAENGAGMFNLRYNELLRISQQIAFHGLTRKVLLKDIDSFTREEQLNDYRELKAFFSMIEGVNRIHRIKLYLQEGLLFSHENTNFFHLSSLENKTSFREAVLKGKDNFTEISTQKLSMEQSIDVLSLGLMFWNFNKTTCYGVIMVETDLEEIERLLDRNRISPDSLLFLTDKDDKVFVQNLSSYEMMDLRMDFMDRESLIDGTLTGSPYFFEEKELSNGQGKILLFEPYSHFLIKIRTLRNETAFFLLFIALVGFILNVLLSEMNTRRLHMLYMKMEKVKKGNFSIREQKYSHDELGFLEERFDKLILSLDNLIEQEKEQQRKLKEGELQLLQSQINPHFLYNALDLIHWKILDLGDAKAGQLVQALARYYRLSLSGGMNIISLADEVEHVKNYILIQNFRYEDKIQFNNCLDTRFSQTLIPKVTLQPLVENAIVHGIQEKGDGGGTLILENWSTGEDLIIQLKDDGVGMTQEKCDRLLKEESNTHFATYNVNHRLKLIFGEQYGLTYFQNLPRGICVQIRIPLKPPVKI